MKYTPQLNVRLVYDFQKSLIRIDDYINFAKENNFSYLFYFENTTMFGVAEFVKKCLINNIKPVFGLSIELKNEQFINVLPLNLKGYKNICRISSFLNTKNIFDETSKINLINKWVDENNMIVFKLNNESVLNLKTLKENEYNVVDKKIFSSFIRYLNPNEKKYYIGLYALKGSTSYQNAYSNYKIDESYPESNMIDQLYKNSQIFLTEIANKSFNGIFENKKVHFGKFQTPNNIPSFQYLKILCMNSLKSYFFKRYSSGNISSDYLVRLEHELNVINSTGFADYFLIVYDYVSFAKNQKIIVGPGRGSAAGSLVSFLLKITTVDPIEYGLLFERFLNPERISMPDIDIDFQDDRRNEVIEYLFEKYGKYNFATIVTYQTIAFKSAFRDACRVYDVNLNFVNMISKEVVDGYSSYEKIVNSSDIIKSFSESEEYKDVFVLTKRLIGIPRQTGTHAAGVVITDIDLRDIVGIKEGAGGIYQSQFDMNHLEEIGLVKMDLLGLKNLTTLNEIIESIRKNQKKEITLPNIDLLDKKVYRLLNRGETTGIFQLESEGMTDVVRKMQVSSVNDIAIASSLFRPGPQEMIPQYIKNKNSISYELVDESIRDILSPTYGIIVYQEQVMQIFQRVGNFSLGKADIVRRAIGKKQIKYMVQFKEEFINNAQKNGLLNVKAESIWAWIEKFANYGFNKSHAIAYSQIGYWLAWFKTYYPAEFYAALLNSSAGNKPKMRLYLQQLKKYGIEVIKPSIKNLNKHFVGFNLKLYMPLTIIQGINKDFVENIREQSQNHRDMFNDLNSFLFYSKNIGLTEQNYDLIAKSGALDCFGYDNLTMLMNKQFVFAFLNSFDINKPLSKQQHQFSLVCTQEPNLELQSQYEKEVFGFYINENPIAKIKNEHSFFKPQDIDKISVNMQKINLIGQVTKIRTIKDKKNQDMAFIELLDDTGTIDITVFASKYNEMKNEIALNKNYVIEINVQEYLNKITGILNKIVKPIK